MEIINILSGIIGAIILLTAFTTYICLILQSSSFTELFLNTAFSWIIVAIPTTIAIAIIYGIEKLLQFIIQLF